MSDNIATTRESDGDPLQRSSRGERWFFFLLPALVLAGLAVSASQSYLLFHTLVEFFSIIVACGMFMTAFNVRRLLSNDYLLFLGIAYLSVAMIDLMHTLTYKGMSIFPGYGPNLPTQLWTAGRYVEVLSIAAAPVYLKRKLSTGYGVGGYFIVTVLLIGAIFLGWFPDCFLEGTGLTPFKIGSEYLFCVLLAAAAGYLWRRREEFDPDVLRLLLGSIGVKMGSELAFTLYIDVHGIMNFTGHSLKYVSFYLLYRAVIETGLSKPFNLLFHSLKRSEASLRESRDALEVRVLERTAALRTSESQLNNALQIARAGNWTYDVENDTFTFNDNIYRIFQTTVEAVGSYTLSAQQYAERFCHPEDAYQVREEIQQALATPDPGYSRQLEHRMLYADGGVGYLSVRFFITKNAKNETVRIYGVIQDVTDARTLEKQAREAQKMEVVGQLAGGIAHDFNNILQVILCGADILRQEHGQNTTALNLTQSISEASERASELVKQLLAFSRKQLIQPNSIDLNAMVSGTLKMLERLIGEHIKIEFHPADPLAPVYADQGQIEQVLMNLCLNARDAMEKGGVLTLATGHAFLDLDGHRVPPDESGQSYVYFTVSDSGHGMTDETRARIFEPFYTTKDIGKGTGLGLAMVYGIVRHHGGFVDVESQVGQGTCFTVFLPPSGVSVETEVREKEFASDRGDETVLAAEDEGGVLKLIVMTLERAGYTVLAASDGNQALDLWNAHKDDIDLIVLDVMMPGMSGREIFDRIRAENDEVRVLFSSGYSEDAIHTDFVIHNNCRVLQKPYRGEALLRAVRTALDE